MTGICGQIADNKHTGSMIFPFFLLVSIKQAVGRLLKNSQ